jgi:hypothetical protein
VALLTAARPNRWAVAFYEHPQRVDGIVYPSRLNGQLNGAVFDRAVHKVHCLTANGLAREPGLAGILNGYRVALMDPVV